jgi:RNA polymerase sigma-70 factor (ECF subfamily)
MTRSEFETLLRQLAEGRQEAFAALYDQFGQRLYRTAVVMLGRREDAEDAEDAVQEVFISLVRSRSRLAEVQDLTAYLFSALRRAVGRLAARRRRGPVLLDVADLETAAKVQTTPVDDRSERLERALRALPAEQREVIALKIDGDLTLAEISQVLQISQNTAASRYRYALEKLRSSMEGHSLGPVTRGS